MMILYNYTLAFQSKEGLVEYLTLNVIESVINPYHWILHYFNTIYNISFGTTEYLMRAYLNH